MQLTARLLTLLLLSPTILSAQTPDQALREAEHELAAALVDKDPAAFARLLAPGFVLRGTPDLSRDEWMKDALAMCWGEKVSVSDFSVVSQTADTAVVSLLLTLHQDPVTCAAGDVRSLLTDVWIREGSSWRLALRHAGPPAATVADQFASVAPPTPRFEGSAELAYVATGGNTDTQTLGAGTLVVWRPGPWTTRGRMAFVRSATADTVTAESFLAEVRPSRALSARLEVFARGEYLADRFSGIDYRTTADAGVGWLLVEQGAHKLTVDGGLGINREARLAGEDLTFASATTSAIYTWQISPVAVLNEQPLLSVAIAEPGNWRWNNRLDLSVTMTRRLSVQLSHQLKRINQPVAGFRRTDTLLSAAVVARF